MASCADGALDLVYYLGKIPGERLLGQGNRKLANKIIYILLTKKYGGEKCK
jgi:hypothetical protein